MKIYGGKRTYLWAGRRREGAALADLKTRHVSQGRPTASRSFASIPRKGSEMKELNLHKRPRQPAFNHNPPADIALGQRGLIVGTILHQPLFPWQRGPRSSSPHHQPWFQPPKASARGAGGRRPGRVWTTRRKKLTHARPRGGFPIAVAVEAAGKAHHKRPGAAPRRGVATARREDQSSRQDQVVGSVLFRCHWTETLRGVYPDRAIGTTRNNAWSQPASIQHQKVFRLESPRVVRVTFRTLRNDAKR